MPKLGKRVGKTQALSQSFKVLATIIGKLHSNVGLMSNLRVVLVNI